MKLQIISVGVRMPSWLSEGWQEYAKRMPPHLSLELVEVEPAHPKEPKRAAIEAEKLILKCSDRAKRVALHGGQGAWSTEKLKDLLEDWLVDGDPVCFFIGGAEGLDDTLVRQADHVWSLGPAVYPHMLVRVLVAEQLYRAWTMIQGHPYHRGDG